MLQKLQNHININFPHLKGKKLLLATSGGIDSMVLLSLFHKLKLDITVAHCNFGLRDAESDADEAFVKATCEALEIPCYIQKFDTNQYALDHKLSIQLAARKLRYDWFFELLLDKKLDYVLTAHHLDDEIETFLINLTRGTGLEGLTGIPSQNDKIIRPLLQFSREQIETFSKENHIKWREDSSNASNKYLRNKLRHDVVPVLKELNPSFMHSFQNTLNHLKQANNLLTEVSNEVYQKIVNSNNDVIEIDLPKLLEYENYKGYLFQWLKKYDFTSWEDIYNLVNAQSGKQVFSETHIVLKDREHLLVFPKTEKVELQEYFLAKNTENLKFPLNISQCNVDNISNTSNNTIFVDEDKIQFPLVIRKWHEGDFFYPSGMKGKKKLSKYFKDEKYSLIDKDNQWLLTSDNEIVWVIGKRSDERFLVNITTQNIIKIEITE
jgi:tRNA(Ile)-lysidine synthase